MQGQGQSLQHHDGDDGSRDPHHNGSVHSNSGMHTSGLLMSTEEEEELRQIRTFHGTIASLQSKCAALETDTFEMEMKVEKQGWDDEAAIEMDMQAERMREEEQKAADKVTEDLRAQLRYHESLLKAETRKNDRAKVEQGLLRRDEREGSNKSRNPSGAPVRRTIPTGSLSAKFGSEAKSNVKGKG